MKFVRSRSINQRNLFFSKVDQKPDTERLQERGVALHGMSEDEEADSDEDGEQEMTEEEMAAAVPRRLYFPALQ